MGKTYVRVDDRLIHGQTIVAWCPSLQIKEIIAIDDVSSANPVLKSIMTMGVPKLYKTHIVSHQEAKQLLSKQVAENRLVIVKFPQVLMDLIEEIKQSEGIVLGNLAKREDTTYKVNGATGIFYLSKQDVEDLDHLVSEGVNITFKQLPSTSQVSWDSFKSTI